MPPVVSVNLTGYSENLPQTPPIAASRDRKLINDQLSVALLGMVNLVNTYYYGKDKKYLKEQLYPYLKELALFWDSYLVKRDGKYIISESGAREEDGGQSLNSIADLALVKFLYKALITASQDLDVDAAQRSGWQEKIDNMSDFPTAANDGKTVFKESLLQDGMSTNGVGDNPVNLHVVFPADAVNSSSPDELQEIARNTVEEMNSGIPGTASLDIYRRSSFWIRSIGRMGTSGGQAQRAGVAGHESHHVPVWWRIETFGQSRRSTPCCSRARTESSASFRLAQGKSEISRGFAPRVPSWWMRRSMTGQCAPPRYSARREASAAFPIHGKGRTWWSKTETTT